MKLHYSVSALALMSTIALAQAQSFTELDTDGNGLLSPEELAVLGTVDFYDADTNKDGGIDTEELAVALQPSGE